MCIAQKNVRDEQAAHLIACFQLYTVQVLANTLHYENKTKTKKKPTTK